MAVDTSSPQNVLMFGATGTIGKYIIASLVASKSQLNRIAIFTSSSTAESRVEELQSLKAQGVEVIVGDLTKEEDVVRAYDGITTVVSALGRNVITAQKDLIRLAAAHPTVTRFYPSEFGTDVAFSPASAHEKPHQAKIGVRKVIEEIASSGDLEYTYIVTGPYADAELPAYLSALPMAPRIGSFDVQGKKAVLAGDGKGGIAMTSCPDVGKLTVAAILHPTASRNRALKVHSFTTTPLAILREFEKQTGGSPWAVEYTSVEDLKVLEQQAWEDKHPIAPIFTLRRIWLEGGTLYERWDNDDIDVKEGETESLATVVARAIELQQKGGGEIDGRRKFV